MNWLELSIETSNELAEAISDALFEYVEGGVVIEQFNDATRTADRWEDEAATGPVVVRAYLPLDETTAQRRNQVEFALRCLNMALHEQQINPIGMPVYREVDTENWAEKWKENYKPIRIGKRVLIRPSWIDRAEVPTQLGEVELVLDPGQAFGTGLHPTTQLCAAALEDVLQPHNAWRVFDIGSGSAILTVLAAKLGAAYVLGVDTDMDAVRTGIDNVELNKVAHLVKIDQGSWDYTHERFDLVVANILAPVIIKMLVQGMAARGPRFVFSGILDTQADAVIAAMNEAGIRLVDRRQMLDWVCLIGETTI